jgi:membrane protein
MRGRLKAVSETVVVSFLIRLFRRFHASRITLLAAALAYYAAFSLGPLLLLLGGWFAVFLRNRPEVLERYRAVLSEMVTQLLPFEENSAALVTRSFDLIVEQLSQGAVIRSVFSVLILIWASTNFFTSLQLALEVIFDVPKVRSFWRKRVVALLLVATVAVVIGVELIGGLLATSLNRLWLVVLQLREVGVYLPVTQVAWGQGLWSELIRLLVATAVFTVAFRYLPRKSSSWLGAIIGAFFSTGSILLARYIFENAFNPESFNLIYGVVTSLLVILLWLYFALLMFLVGALIVAEISSEVRAKQRQQAREEAMQEELKRVPPKESDPSAVQQ